MRQVVILLMLAGVWGFKVGAKFAYIPLGTYVGIPAPAAGRLGYYAPYVWVSYSWAPR